MQKLNCSVFCCIHSVSVYTVDITLLLNRKCLALNQGFSLVIYLCHLVPPRHNFCLSYFDSALDKATLGYLPESLVLFAQSHLCWLSKRSRLSTQNSTQFDCCLQVQNNSLNTLSASEELKIAIIFMAISSKLQENCPMCGFIIVCRLMLASVCFSHTCCIQIQQSSFTFSLSISS